MVFSLEIPGCLTIVVDYDVVNGTKLLPTVSMYTVVRTHSVNWDGAWVTTQTSLMTSRVYVSIVPGYVPRSVRNCNGQKQTRHWVGLEPPALLVPSYIPRSVRRRKGQKRTVHVGFEPTILISIFLSLVLSCGAVMGSGI